MAENNSPVGEPLRKTGQAAVSTVRFAKSAAKLGKTVAATAKGAAAGSIYGAIAAFVWENRRLIFKITVASLVVILIPVLVVCMLPSVIFDGLSEPYSVDNPNALILNDSTVITNNINRISESVGSVMSDAKGDVLAEIERDFECTDAERKEINDPYNSTTAYSIASFVSQYSAYRSNDISLISISDMESTLRTHNNKLYSYTKSIEEKVSVIYTETTDAQTGEKIITENEVVETVAVYTVVYNGEEYFADNVFHLTDKQKALAADYRENLKLFLSEGEIWEQIK